MEKVVFFRNITHFNILISIRGKGHLITGHQGPRGGVEA
jgi:hypothetical protein